MKDKAIAKITEEAMAINDPLAFAIEECLINRCTTTTIAQKILAEDKKLEEIHKQLIDKAQKSAKPLKGAGRGTGFDIEPDILAYYGIDQAASSAPRAAAGRVDVLDLF